LVRAVISAPDTLMAARDRARELAREVHDDQNHGRIGDRAAAAALAAIAAVHVACAGELETTNLNADDAGVDPELWSPEYHAELALNGEPDDATQRDERRAFWCWWLDEAATHAASGQDVSS
jgi:hypothetical protein